MGSHASMREINQRVGDTYSSYVILDLQNGSPDAPDYGWGVGEVIDADIDIHTLLHSVVGTITARHPDYSTKQAFWDALSFQVWYFGEVELGWEPENDPVLRPYPFEQSLHLVNRGGDGGGIDYDTWNNFRTDPDSDTLSLIIHLGEALDFDQDGRVDPDEILIWNGQKGGQSVDSTYYEIPSGQGVSLNAGIGRSTAAIPILSIQDSHTLGETIQINSGAPESLNFTATRADPLDDYRWIYIVQSSTDLQTWTHRAHYPGNQQAVAHPITATAASEFWRIRIANEKDYQAFDLRPSDQTISAPGATLTWKGAETAGRYEIYLSTDSSIESDEFVTTVTEPTFDISTLQPQTTYYWQTVAVFADELKVASSVHRFTTHPE